MAGAVVASRNPWVGATRGVGLKGTGQPASADSSVVTRLAWWSGASDVDAGGCKRKVRGGRHGDNTISLLLLSAKGRREAAQLNIRSPLGASPGIVGWLQPTEEA